MSVMLFAFDAANQLIREDNGFINKTVTYTYDSWGNILTKSEYLYTTGTLGTPSDTVVYTYGNSAWGDQLTSYDGETISYDAMGNPVSYRGYTTSFEGKQLVSAVKSGKNITFAYDENGLRTQKTVNNVTTNYYYNGSVLISQVSGNDTLLFSYDASGNVVSVNFNGTDYYYVRNGQGDVVKFIDGNGTIVTEYTYDTWGKLVSCTGSLSATLGTINPFRYRGYVYDYETGFYYLQSRYYDSEVCRFINADVFLSTGQGVLGHNTFAYCLNNPANMSDPSGTIPWWLLLLLLVSTAASTGCAGNADQADNDSSQGSHGIDTEYNGNCYQYATGTTYSILGGGCFFPGYTKGRSNTERFSDAGTLATCIQSDLNACYKRRKRRFSVEPCEANYEPEGNQWKIAYCYGDDDFHFFRYDTNVGWTHKPGWDTEVTSNDFAGNPISDLSSADLGRYNADTLIYFVIKEAQYE